MLGARSRLKAGVACVRRLMGRIRYVAARSGVLDALVRLRHGRTSYRRAREARRVTPAILVGIPAGSDGGAPTDWTRSRFVRTLSDMTVILAGPPAQFPRAVIKLPATTSAANSLRSECEVLASLRADGRLGEWRTMLPAVLSNGQLGGRPYVVQSVVPGVSALELVDRPGGDAVLTAAAVAVGELHRRTARRVIVDRERLGRWVDRPALQLRHVGVTRTADAPAASAIDRLVEELYGALEGRPLSLSWIHGDFVPSNIMVSAEGRGVMGIVDWELATEDGLPTVDVAALLLSARAHRLRREVGQVVRDIVTGARWTPFEQAVLNASRARLPDSGVDSRTLILLWWLQHVTSNLTKSSRYTGGGLWARWNIRPVIDALVPR